MPFEDRTTSTVRYVVLPEFPDYRIGDDGSVYRRWDYGPGIGFQWRRLGGTKNHSGGRVVFLTRADGTGATRPIHRLVLEAFVGPRPEGTECCHNDGNPANNRLENLRWDTHRANMQDTIKHGTRAPVFGTHSANARLDEARVATICDLIRAGERATTIARQFGVSRAAINNIKDGKSWVHVSGGKIDMPWVSRNQGGEHHHAKLTAADIPLIHRMLAEGKTLEETGRRFGITKSSVYAIVIGKSWRHVNDGTSDG
jgi:DNA-binding CsgD family transcriptional regulator